MGAGLKDPAKTTAGPDLAGAGTLKTKRRRRPETVESGSGVDSDTQEQAESGVRHPSEYQPEELLGQLAQFQPAAFPFLVKATPARRPDAYPGNSEGSCYAAVRGGDDQSGVTARRDGHDCGVDQR